MEDRISSFEIQQPSGEPSNRNTHLQKGISSCFTLVMIFSGGLILVIIMLLIMKPSFIAYDSEFKDPKLTTIEGNSTIAINIPTNHTPSFAANKKPGKVSNNKTYHNQYFDNTDSKDNLKDWYNKNLVSVWCGVNSTICSPSSGLSLDIYQVGASVVKPNTLFTPNKEEATDPLDQYAQQYIKSIILLAEKIDENIGFITNKKYLLNTIIPRKFGNIMVQKYTFIDYGDGIVEFVTSIMIKKYKYKYNLRRIPNITGKQVKIHKEYIPTDYLVDTFISFSLNITITDKYINTIWYIIEDRYKAINPLKNRFEEIEIRTVMIDMINIFNYLIDHNYVINDLHWMNFVGKKGLWMKLLIGVKLADIGNIARSRSHAESEAFKGNIYKFIKTFLMLSMKRIETNNNTPVSTYLTKNNTDSITTKASILLVDFFYVFLGHCEHLPRKFDDMTTHPFITGKMPSRIIDSDVHGKRFYRKA